MPLTIVKQIRPAKTFTLSECPQVLAWHPQSLLLASIPADGKALLLDPDNHTHNEVRQPASKVTDHSLAWSPNGKHLAIGQSDGSVCISDLKDTLVSERIGLGWVEYLAWESAGQWLAAAAGKDMKILSLPSLQVAFGFEKLKSTPSGIAFRPKHKSQLLVARNGGLDRFDLGNQPNSLKAAKSYEFPTSLLNLRLSPNGKYAACGCQDNSVRYWELDTGDNLQMSGYPAKVRHLDWSPDSLSLHTIGLSILMTWSFAGKGPEGTAPAEVELHEAAVTALAVHPVNGLIASGDEQGVLIVWRLDQGKVLPMQTKSGTSIVLAAWHPVLPWLAVGYMDGTVELWHLPSKN